MFCECTVLKDFFDSSYRITSIKRPPPPPQEGRLFETFCYFPQMQNINDETLHDNSFELWMDENIVEAAPSRLTL